MREESRAGVGAVTLGPRREWGRSAGRPRGGPPVGGRRPGAQALGSQISGLGPLLLRYPGISPHIPAIWNSSPNLFKPGSLFYTISNIWGSGPRVHQCPGFIPQAFKYRIHFLRVQIYGVHTPQSNPGFSNCRPRVGGGLDREVRSGCHPLPSRGGFPGPPLRKGESRGRGGKGRGLLAPLPAWQSRWRTPGGSGGTGAP